MNRIAGTALVVMMTSLFFFTACVSSEQSPPEGVSAAGADRGETSPGAAPVKKDGSGTGETGREESKKQAGEEILREAGETARKTIDRAVAGKNGEADEKEKEEVKEEQPFPNDPVEREEDVQEQVWESEDSAEEDHGNSGEERAVKGSGDIRDEQESESPHIHDWVEQTKTVHHDETGHYEEVMTGKKTVVDEEAYDEPVYEIKCVCSACGYEADSTDEIGDHMDSHYDPELGYIDASYSVQEVVTDVIHHPEVSHEEPVYEEQWIIDSEAWDETVVTGYRCSTCGAVK